MTGPRSTPLLDMHRALGARLTEFGGWDMPLQYEGIVAEHNAVRSDVGVFDVSHLGKLRVAGADAGAALDRAFTADVGSLVPGRAAYALALTDDGGVIDDVFVYRMDSDEWLVVPNAANVEAIGRAIEDAGAAFEDLWDRWAILAIQGPRSFEIVDTVFPGSGATELKLHAWKAMEVFGEAGFVARTGYTGERGFELYAPSGTAPKALAALLDAGVRPVGLGARDTLRLEMGYALYGHELALDINPLEAGLGWVLAWDTPFRGRDALRAVKELGPVRRSFALRCSERGVPRRGYRVLSDGDQVGTLTSGNHSPSLGTGIGLALGPADRRPEVGSAVAIEARGRTIAADIVKPPFVSKDRP